MYILNNNKDVYGDRKIAMKCRVIMSVIAVLYAIALGSLGSSVHGAVLERNHISRFHVTEVHSGATSYLHIRGHYQDSSATGCGKLQIRRHGDDLRLKASELFLRKGRPLDYVVKVDPGVKRVVFGNARAQIWPVDAGAPVYSEEERKALDLAIKEFRSRKPDLSVDDFYVFVDKQGSSASGEYPVIFFQDGPTPSPVSEIYTFFVHPSDGAVIDKGRRYAGPGLLLKQLGKGDEIPLRPK